MLWKPTDSRRFARFLSSGGNRFPCETFSDGSYFTGQRAGKDNSRNISRDGFMYLTRTPGFVQNLFPGFIWRKETTAKELFLTFDDGPVPDVTPWVLDVLSAYEAHASFFCVGENVRRYPVIYRRILSEGHAVGNHTYNHISGWSHDSQAYMDNVSNCSELVNSNLFRPPYGRLGRKHARSLIGQQYRIVMWDVLSGDFDRDIDPEQCYHNVVDNARSGSIIVFHDSLKAENNLKSALPKVLEFYSRQGYQFMPLSIGAAHASQPQVRQLA